MAGPSTSRGPGQLHSADPQITHGESGGEVVPLCSDASYRSASDPGAEGAGSASASAEQAGCAGDPGAEGVGSACAGQTGCAGDPGAEGDGSACAEQAHNFPV